MMANILREISTKIHLRQIFRFVDIDSETRILEVGCNRGYFTKKLMRFSDNVHGIDIDKDVIFNSKKEDHNGFTCDAEDLAFADNSFDLLITIHTIEHINNLEKSIKEFTRVLVAGGELVLIYPYEPIVGITCIPGLPLSKQGNKHLRKLKPKNLIETVRDHNIGLEPICSKLYYSLFPAFISIFRKS